MPCLLGGQFVVAIQSLQIEMHWKQMALCTFTNIIKPWHPQQTWTRFLVSRGAKCVCVGGGFSTCKYHDTCCNVLLPARQTPWLPLLRDRCLHWLDSFLRRRYTLFRYDDLAHAYDIVCSLLSCLRTFEWYKWPFHTRAQHSGNLVLSTEGC